MKGVHQSDGSRAMGGSRATGGSRAIAVGREPIPQNAGESGSLHSRELTAARREVAPDNGEHSRVRGQNAGTQAYTPPGGLLRARAEAAAKPAALLSRGFSERTSHEHDQDAESDDFPVRRSPLLAHPHTEHTLHPHTEHTLPEHAQTQPSGLPVCGGDADPEVTDESLLVRLQRGEPEALSQLWRRYAGLLYTQALGVLHNPAEAEDIVVEVFSEVWRRAAGYHPERARPVAWLVTLVRRRAIDRLRERRSYEKAGVRLAMENRGALASANSNGEEMYGEGVEDQVHLSELRTLLEQALDYLPEQQKETVRLVYFHGLTQKEIAARTCTPLGTVKTRLELGLRKMRERIRGARMRLAMQVRPP